MPKEFDINILMGLCEEQKYATTVAGFEVIDMNEVLEVPKKMHKNKPAVRAMSILGEDLVQWNYIGEEERQALREELGLSVPEEAEPSLSNTKVAVQDSSGEAKGDAKSKEAKDEAKSEEAKSKSSKGKKETKTKKKA